MDSDPDAVAETVSEMIAVAAGVDHLAGDAVDLAPAAARGDCLHALALRLEHELVDAPGVLARLAGRDRARAVRAVAVELGAPVDHDHLPRSDDHVARLGVGQCAVRSGGDDRLEAGALRAAHAQLALERQRQVALGSADQPVAQQLL